MELERSTTSKATVAPTAPWIALFAFQDVLLLGYLFTVWALLRRAGGGAQQAVSFRHVYLSLALTVLGPLFARGLTDVSSKVRAMVYRLTLTGVLLENYLMLRDVLPLLRTDHVDAALYSADLRLFGFEPALWLERLNVRPVVEYFAFFYFSYFGICIAFLVGVVYLSRLGRQTTEFAVGTILVFCIGQLGYVAVPAYGPVVALRSAFAGPLQGGLFWGFVSQTVAAGGAMKDVFPSLHTAVPIWFALFAFHRARTDRRFRWPARITAFFAANIVFSTMFLRWHYAVDVIAGVVLAVSVGLLVPRIARWDEARRSRLGFEGAWLLP
jgi:membrane-associated phospholipid phosphatase